MILLAALLLGNAQPQALTGQSVAHQAKYTVLLGGRNIGSATIYQKLSSTGAKEVSIKMQLKDGGKSVSIRQQSAWTADGLPTKKFLEVTNETPPSVLTKTAEFGKTKVTVAIDENGTTKGLIAKADSEYWFIRDEPELNQTCKYWSFNLDKMEWDQTDTIYQGEKKVQVGGKPIQGFRVKSTSSARILDSIIESTGLPLVIEDQNGLKFVREGLTK